MPKYPRIRLKEDPVPLPQTASLPNDIALPSQTMRILQKVKATRYWQMLAYVDVSEELNPIRQSCCRYCHGEDHQYQYTLNEYRDAKIKFEQSQSKRHPHDKLIFEYTQGAGGYGYDIKRKPNPDCPECHGFGISVFVPIDMSKLSLAARMLYDGIKINKDGTTEIKLRSRDRAMENLQRI